MLIETLPWLSAELAEITEESEADVDGDEYYGGRKKTFKRYPKREVG